MLFCRAQVLDGEREVGGGVPRRFLRLDEVGARAFHVRPRFGESRESRAVGSYLVPDVHHVGEVAVDIVQGVVARRRRRARRHAESERQGAGSLEECERAATFHLL